MAAIDQWWSRNPSYNIGMVPEQAGLFVVDLDIKGGGLENWTALEGDKPATYTVATPSGGWHLYFTGSGPTGASRLAPGIDTRGRGGYVLVPPSVVDDLPYWVVDDTIAAAPLPAWITESLDAGKREKLEAARGVGGESLNLDLPGNIERARVYLRGLVKAGDVAIEGQGGNDRTYRTAQIVLDTGLSVEEALVLMLDEWNGHCDPPWENDELHAIIDNAWRYRQNAPGAYAAAEGVPEAWQRYDEAAAQEPPRPSRFRLVSPIDAMRRAPPTYWDAHKLLLRQPGGSVNMIYAAFSNFKSTWSANYLLATAKGAGARVLYVLGEGTGGFAPLTLAAAIDSWNMDHPDNPVTPGWLADHFQLVEAMPQLLTDGDMIEAAEEWRAWAPDLIFLDTLGNAAAGQNLSAIEIGTAVGRASRLLAATLGVDLYMLHHEGKGGDAMGSQYIVGNDPDLVLHIEHVKERVAVTVHKDRWGERGRTVQFGVRKIMVNLAGGTMREFVATHELAAGTIESEAAQQQRMAKDQVRRVYDHVIERIEQGERVGRDNRAEHGPGQIAHMLGLDQPTVERAMHACHLDGRLRWEKGPPSGWAAGHVTPLRAAVEEVY